MKYIFKYLSAKYFFKDYASGVRNFTHKMRGVDGNGKPIEFSKEDVKEIKYGLQKMTKDVSRRLG